jgi:hypothetical protein
VSVWSLDRLDRSERRRTADRIDVRFLVSAETSRIATAFLAARLGKDVAMFGASP